MSILAQQTEKKALKEIAKSLRFFENLDQMEISAEDAYKIRNAENTIRAVIETNGYKTGINKHNCTILKKIS